MSDPEGNFMDVTSYCDVPLSPTPTTILSMLNQTNNSQNIMTEIFSQSNTQRSGGFGERLARRIEFQLPTLDRNSISPYVAFFRGPRVVPSSISPGFSPSAFLQSPNMLSDSSSQIPLSTIVNNRPPQTIEGSDESLGNNIISNNDFPHQQPMHVDQPPQEGFNNIVAEECVNVLSHESHVEPNGPPLVEPNVNIISMQEESRDDKDEEDDKEDKDRDVVDVDRDIVDGDKDEEKYKDKCIIDLDELDVGETSSLKKRKCDHGSNIGATRTEKQKRVTIRMECEEENPDDGFHWRKYGRKIVKGNPNPRSYYKCIYNGCKVKKHVEREAGNEIFLVTTYEGIHEHHAPPPRESGPNNQKSSSQHINNRIGRRLDASSSKSLAHMDSRPPFTLLGRLYTTGLSKVSSLPVTGSIHQSDHFMHRSNQYANHNLRFIHSDDQMVNQDSNFRNQNNQLINQNSSLVSMNDGLINQNSRFIYRNGQPVNQDPRFMVQNEQLVNQNPFFMSQSNQLVNQNPSFVSRNDQLPNHS